VIVAWQDEPLVSLARILQNSLQKVEECSLARAAIEERDYNL
jgi:hypothetical protein